MAVFSLSRIAQYARYHYVSQIKNYIAFILVMAGVPLLFGVLSRDMNTVTGMVPVVYICGALGISKHNTYAMRDRGMKILECTLPLSNEERMTFMVFNSAVVYPIISIVATIVAISLVQPFDYAEVGFVRGIRGVFEIFYFEWTFYVLIQIICSSSLLINIVARRSLFIAYIGAFVGILIFFGTLGRIGFEICIHYAEKMRQIEIMSLPEPVSIALYCLIPVVFYLLAYWALRKRQIKW